MPRKHRIAKGRRVRVLGIDLYARMGSVAVFGFGKLVMYRRIGDYSAFSLFGLTLYCRVAHARRLLGYAWISKCANSAR